MAETQHGVVWIDGKLTSLPEALIPVSDRGFLFGHAIFETILALGDSLVFWEAHLARLRAGSLRARIQCPSEKELLTGISAALNFFSKESGKSSQSRISVRLILTGGDGLSLAPARSEKGELFKGRVVVICKPATPLSDSEWHQGFSLKTCPDTRNKELVDIKSCNYLWNMMCLDDALIEGFDDALFVNSSGEISEASTSSFVWMSRDENCIYSAPQESNVLPGTTLMCLQNALEALGHSVKWRPLHVTNLSEAVACAVISSVRGLVPIRQIDQHVFDVIAFRRQLELWNQALYAEQIRNCESLRT
ncbi:MAG: hypothetical protein RJB13_1757 [Pseudomonadota bacterium]